MYLHACQVSYRRRLRYLLLYLCYVVGALINSLVCLFCTSAVGHILFQIFALNMGQSFALNMGQSFALNMGQSFALNMGQSFALNMVQSFALDMGLTPHNYIITV